MSRTEVLEHMAEQTQKAFGFGLLFKLFQPTLRLSVLLGLAGEGKDGPPLPCGHPSGTHVSGSDRCSDSTPSHRCRVEALRSIFALFDVSGDGFLSPEAPDSRALTVRVTRVTLPCRCRLLPGVDLSTEDGGLRGLALKSPAWAIVIDIACHS